MTTCVSHWTALRWHLRQPCWQGSEPTNVESIPIPDDAPNAAEVADLLRALGSCLPEIEGQTPQIDVLVAKSEGRRATHGITCHTCSTQLPKGSIQRSGLRGYDILVTSPELTFVQIVATEDMRVAAYVGMALCFSFRIDEFEESGLARREAPEGPLTSTKIIAAFLRRAKGLYGVDKARDALRYVRDGALSPPEGGIALLSMLKPRLGGFD